MNKQKRVSHLRRDCRGRFTDIGGDITLREFIRRFTVTFQWAIALSALAGLAFILATPPRMFNPLIGIETVGSVEAHAMPSNSNSSKAEPEDNLDQRIEECWAKGWQPGVLERGFVCAAPAVDLPTK